MEGAQIGSYRIHRKLGEGGMGTVYVGEHALLGRRAAIKVLLPSMSANQEVVNRFFNEARATTSIADPGIVQIFDFGYHTDGSAYIVMELLEGESFDQRLRRLGRFAPFDAIRLMRQVATSLGAAHALGIVHRDLKPDNLFVVADAAVTGGERPKILDFGIAKLAGDDPGRHKTRTGTLMGTPLYMSPEQCRGAGTIDHRSDIYALGCVLFCMLTGRPPFDGEGVGDILYAHMGLPPPAPSAVLPGLPPAIDHVVLRCLAKAPDQRFQTMHELAAAMSAVEQQLTGVQVYMQQPVAGSVGPAAYPHATTAATTHGASAGQIAVAAPAKRGSGRVIGIAAALAIAGGIAAVVATRGGGDAAPREVAPVAAPPPADAPPPPPPPPDAAIAPVDAAISVDAAPAVDAAIPADAPAAPPPKRRKKQSDDSKAPQRPRIDRGD